MKVVYVATHPAEHGETVLCIRPENSGVPRAGDLVRLHPDRPALIVETVTLLPGREWRVVMQLSRQDAESLRSLVRTDP